MPPAALRVSLGNWSERPEQREAGAGAQLVAQSRPGGRDVPTAQAAFIGKNSCLPGPTAAKKMLSRLSLVNQCAAL